MSTIALDDIYLVGLSLKTKTTNANGQSHKDCENLWYVFDKGGYADRITGKLGAEVYGVYHQYEGDSSHPFSYFIGYRVKKDSPVPEGLEALVIPAGWFEKIVVKGKMPDCVVAAWKTIWTASYPRTYTMDFEVYDERSKDWGSAEIDVFVSVKE